MIWGTAVSVIFFAGFALFLVRFAREAGFILPKNRVMSAVAADKTPVRVCETTTARECLCIFLFAIAFRIIVFLVAWAAYGIFAECPTESLLEFCSQWRHMGDSEHYLEIAQTGYAHVEDGQHLFLVFFPLYPALVRLAAFVIRDYVVSGLVVSTLCYGAGCVMMYKLVAIDYNKHIARTSVVLFSIAPQAFFMGCIMTEGTFFLVIIATFYAIRKHKWWLAGILGIFASLTRSVGVFMVVPAAVEWVKSERPVAMIADKNWRLLGKRFLKLLPVALMPIGTLIYLYINYKVEGDPFVFLKYEREHWFQTMQFFGKTVKVLSYKVFFDRESLWTSQASMYVPGLFSITFAAIAILLSARRMRSMYTAFMIVYFLFNASPTWPMSEARYMCCMFPAYWLIAAFTDEHRELEAPIAVMSAALFGLYLTGYITVHQIF